MSEEMAYIHRGFIEFDDKSFETPIDFSIDPQFWFKFYKDTMIGGDHDGQLIEPAVLEDFNIEMRDEGGKQPAFGETIKNIPINSLWNAGNSVFISRNTSQFENFKRYYFEIPKNRIGLTSSGVLKLTQFAFRSTKETLVYAVYNSNPLNDEVFGFNGTWASIGSACLIIDLKFKYPFFGPKVEIEGDHLVCKAPGNAGGNAGGESSENANPNSNAGGNSPWNAGGNTEKRGVDILTLKAVVKPNGDYVITWTTEQKNIIRFIGAKEAGKFEGTEVQIQGLKQ